ncbi:hypothetical protein PPTG_22560 [Phytophthora nicotianae INRA-310]|uniref:glucan endo-1,3-beta-D-glucosidase n=1 Tax=Phytophthora nicotianae (strain INRA-310) TaxID=761204 RepID=W2QGQ0_PHYN3|nr:hypothetical protein PPTG_22560 [Phytophthora nicotianae INRA-310]ETN12051.1 hypothetical protein PPTG_22560 [Phytophthora nicotianae INRA-310]
MKLFLPTLVASVVLMLNGGADALNVKMPGVNYNSRKGPDWAPDSSKCKTASEAELVLPAAKNAGLKVHLGIWTTKSHDYLLQEKAKLAGLIDKGLYDNNVIGLHVGSETIYREEITADTAISYLKEIRGYIRSRGKNTPVTIADVIDIYYANQQLIDAVDYISVNQFSFWERSDVNEGAAVTLDRLKSLRVAAAKKNKKIVISEVGWSSGGSDPAAAVATPANQAKFFSDFFQMARSHNFDYYCKSTDWLVQEQQVWFFDSATQQVRSKSSDRCLDAYQGWNGGIVHVYRCMDHEVNQKWTLESSTGKLKHVKHQGFCLDTDPAQGNKLQLYGCSPNNPNQQWSVINPANI